MDVTRDFVVLLLCTTVVLFQGQIVPYALILVI
jgi:hypothetical protein